VFTLIASLSWLYLADIKALLSGGLSRGSISVELPSDPPPLDAQQIPALPSSEVKIAQVEAAAPKPEPTKLGRRDLSAEQIRLIVTTKADIYVLDQSHQERLLCSGSMVCDVPLDRDVVVRAEGYYERPLYRLELSEHRGSEWMLNLVKTNR